MLDTHRNDLRIIRAASGRRGVTIKELHEQLIDDGEGRMSLTAIRRHLPGLMSMGQIRGELEVRDSRIVTVFRSGSFSPEVRRAFMETESGD